MMGSIYTHYDIANDYPFHKNVLLLANQPNFPLTCRLCPAASLRILAAFQTPRFSP
jgi:hypothetical protein